MTPKFLVDFNEMLEPDLVLLAKKDARTNWLGETVTLRPGMAVDLFMEDFNERGDPDNLVASGTVEENKSSGWGAHVKWCCRINSDGIRHESDV